MTLHQDLPLLHMGTMVYPCIWGIPQLNKGEMPRELDYFWNLVPHTHGLPCCATFETRCSDKSLHFRTEFICSCYICHMWLMPVKHQRSKLNLMPIKYLSSKRSWPVVTPICTELILRDTKVSFLLSVTSEHIELVLSEGGLIATNCRIRTQRISVPGPTWNRKSTHLNLGYTHTTG